MTKRLILKVNPEAYKIGSFEGCKLCQLIRQTNPAMVFYSCRCGYNQSYSKIRK